MIPSASSKRRRWPLLLGALAAALVLAVGICEALGWPFLAAPMQRWLTKALDRPVSFASDPNSPAKIRIGLIGSIRAQADTIVIGAPTWSNAPHMLRVRDAELKLGYLDVWRATRGQALRIRSLKAAQLDSQLERLADGRASWQFGAKPVQPDTADKPVELPRFDELLVGAGALRYADALSDVNLDALFSLTDGTARQPAAGGAASAALPSSPAAASQPAGPASAPAGGLQLTATGRYRKQPIRIDVATPSVLPLLGDDIASVAFPITLDATIGRASLAFRGTATDVVKLSQLRGRFTLAGPSLAAVGDPLGVTLPTTPAFRTGGLIVKEGLIWNAVFEQATIGSSRVAGAFTYDTGRKQPLLSGRLTGSRLLLADVGPAIGTPAPAAGQPGAANATNRATRDATKKAPRDTPKDMTKSATKSATKTGKVLPDRPFDLPALRAMDANVVFDIDYFDLGSDLLQPLRPLRTHLVLSEGVLTLNDIDARTAQGRLAGSLRLDGRNAQALWNADIRWNGVRLENWIKQTRADNAPPYVSGRLNGQATLTGQGRSTAAILGSLKGGIRMYLMGGSISHLAIEAAGLDVAQALGVLVDGDDVLPIECTVADLVVDRGLLRPNVFLLDTSDTTLWIDGNLSLASEALDLRVVVMPKDFSFFALRTPVRVRGTFADPAVSVEVSKIAMRVGAAALLALVNPLAAVLPFMDAPSGDGAREGAEKCRALTKRAAGGKPAAAAKPAPVETARPAATSQRR